MCQICKLNKLHEGDSFRFCNPINQEKNKTYVVEGQYPFKHITTIISEVRIMQPDVEPIAVNDTHEVEVCVPNKYTIKHLIKKNK